jgi:probable F420-dependent oxidoreductase
MIELGRVGLWTSFDPQPASRVRELAAAIEEMGWPTVWFPESSGRDAFVTASLLLGATTTLNVATGIAQIHGRDPVTMAAAQKATYEAHDGRFLLGLGVSHARMIESVRRQPYDRPYSFMKDYLARMDEAPYKAYPLDDSPPRVLAALGPKMLALARDAAQGAHPYFVPPEHTAIAREAMGPGPLLAPEQMVLLDADATSARDAARSAMVRYLTLPNYTNNLRRLGFDEDDIAGASDRLVDAIVAWGTIEQVADRVQAHLDAGADHVCVQAIATEAGEVPTAQWRELSDALL